MSDDRELLELAAKAAGHPIIRWETDEDGVELAVIDSGYWQPLHMNTTTDCMGDALRLAVKLQLDLFFDLPAITVFGPRIQMTGDAENDPQAATPPAPPEGWRMVPVEPTTEMLERGVGAHYEAECKINEPGAWGNGGFAKRSVRAAHVYRAMLAAAPQPGDEA